MTEGCARCGTRSITRGVQEFVRGLHLCDLCTGLVMDEAHRLRTEHLTWPSLVDRPAVQVYFAVRRDLGLVKIGASTSPATRAKKWEAELVHVEDGAYEREQQLHEMFFDYRVSPSQAITLVGIEEGRTEWFRFEGEVREYLEAA